MNAKTGAPAFPTALKEQECLAEKKVARDLMLSR
jgi:hypothetical protein